MNPTPSRIKTKELYIRSVIQIICQEGHEAVTVRKLSERTGYTYPTLYHHFPDLGELMLAAKNQMINNMVPVIMEDVQHGNGGITGLKETFRAYLSYYVKNPNVFRFFYYYMFPANNGDTTRDVQAPDFESMWFNTFSELISNGTIRQEDVKTIAKTIIYSIHGILTLIFSNSGELTTKNALGELDGIIDYLIKQ